MPELKPEYVCSLHSSYECEYRSCGACYARVIYEKTFARMECKYRVRCVEIHPYKEVSNVETV